VSISPTFYEHNFCTKVFLQLFSTYSLALSFFVERISVQKLLIEYIGEIDGSNPMMTIKWRLLSLNFKKRDCQQVKQKENDIRKKKIDKKVGGWVKERKKI